MALALPDDLSFALAILLIVGARTDYAQHVQVARMGMIVELHRDYPGVISGNEFGLNAVGMTIEYRSGEDNKEHVSRKSSTNGREYGPTHVEGRLHADDRFGAIVVEFFPTAGNAFAYVAEA